MGQKPSFDSVEESNPSKPSLADRTRTTNEAGGEAFEAFSAEFALYKVVLNNLLEDQYYDTADESLDKIWARFDAVANENPEFVLQLAAYARQEEGFRDIAQLLLVLSANDDRTKPYVRDYAPAIIDRTDEFNSVVSYQLRGYGSPIPKPLKKGIEDSLHKRWAVIQFETDGGLTETTRVTYIESQDDGCDIPKDVIYTGADRVAEIHDISPDWFSKWSVRDQGYIHDRYTCAKYSERDKDVSLHDVLNLVHPKPRSDNRNQLFASIVKGELSEGQAEKEHWEVGPNYAPEQVEPLREDRTWEATMSDNEDDRSEYEKWHDRLEDMGLMARVRNLRNMREAGISGNHIFDYDVVGVGEDGTGGVVFGENSEAVVREHQMFSFRLYQAYKACTESGTTRSRIGRPKMSFNIAPDGLLDDFSATWLNDAIDASTQNLPETMENTFTAIDLSGSMDKPVSNDSSMARAEIGSLFGAMLLKRRSDCGVFGTDFATVTADPNARADTATLELAQRIYACGDQIGNNTNAYKVLEWALDTEQAYDRFVVFSDMQLWNDRGYSFGSSDRQSFKQLWDQYTEQVNPDAHLYLIDLAQYGDLSMPEGYHNVHQISGWSESIIRFIDSFEQADDVIDSIETIEPEDY